MKINTSNLIGTANVKTLPFFHQKNHWIGEPSLSLKYTDVSYVSEILDGAFFLDSTLVQEDTNKNANLSAEIADIFEK